MVGQWDHGIGMSSVGRTRRRPTATGLGLIVDLHAKQLLRHLDPCTPVSHPSLGISNHPRCRSSVETFRCLSQRSDKSLSLSEQMTGASGYSDRPPRKSMLWSPPRQSSGCPMLRLLETLLRCHLMEKKLAAMWANSTMRAICGGSELSFWTCVR